MALIYRHGEALNYKYMKKRLFILNISLIISLLLVIATIIDSLINKREMHFMSLLLIPMGIAGYYAIKKKMSKEK